MIFSSTLSGFGFVGGPGLVYRMGMSSIWMVVCASTGFIIAFALLGLDCRHRENIFRTRHRNFSGRRRERGDLHNDTTSPLRATGNRVDRRRSSAPDL